MLSNNIVYIRSTKQLSKVSKKTQTSLYAFVRDFVQGKGKPFTVNDIQDEFQKRNPEADMVQFANSIGGVMSMLAMWKRIKIHGSMPTRNKAAHGRPITELISIEYSLSQSAKSKGRGAFGTLDAFDQNNLS